MRKIEGGDTSNPAKPLCDVLRVKFDGCGGEVTNFGKSIKINDFNHYRSRGHDGQFSPGTKDRALSLMTAASYDALRLALPTSNVRNGDLGENVILGGPTSDDLQVGRRLRLGPTCVVEITQANTPCFRLNNVSWAAAAKKKWGDERVRWFKNDVCPLSRYGGRGWLCKVLTEGDVRKNDVVTFCD